MIKLNNINKKYNDLEVFKDYNLILEDNTITVLKGISGRGKTTLLNIIAGITTIDSGEVYIDEVLLKQPNSAVNSKILREKINIVFQDFVLVENKSIKYNLELALKYQTKEVDYKQLLKKLNINCDINKKVKNLSGGEKQRIAIIRSLIKPGNIILMDEPSSNIDDDNVVILLDILKELKQNHTILIISHDSVFDEVSDRTILL